MQTTNNKKIQSILNNPCASYWLKNALRAALDRDCCDAARDAELLNTLLSTRADEVLAEAQG